MQLLPLGMQDAGGAIAAIIVASGIFMGCSVIVEAGSKQIREGGLKQYSKVSSKGKIPQTRWPTCGTDQRGCGGDCTGMVGLFNLPDIDIDIDIALMQRSQEILVLESHYLQVRLLWKGGYQSGGVSESRTHVLDWSNPVCGHAQPTVLKEAADGYFRQPARSRI